MPNQGTTYADPTRVPKKVDPVLKMKQLIAQVAKDPFSVNTMPSGNWYQDIKAWHPGWSYDKFQPLLNQYNTAFSSWMKARSGGDQGQQAAQNAANTQNVANQQRPGIPAVPPVMQAPQIPQVGGNTMAKPVYNYPKEVNYSFLTKALPSSQQAAGGLQQGARSSYSGGVGGGYVPPAPSGGGTGSVGGGYTPPQPAATIPGIPPQLASAGNIPGIGDIGNIIQSLGAANPFQQAIGSLLPQLQNQLGNYFSQSNTNSQFVNPYELQMAELAKKLETMSSPALDPRYQANLNTQRASALQQSEEAFNQRASKQLADLYGRGINRSNVADQAVQALARDEGLMTGQINANFAGQENAAMQQNWQQLAQQMLQSAGILGQLGGQELQSQQLEQGLQGDKLRLLLELVQKASGGQVDPMALLQLLMGQKNQDREFAMRQQAQQGPQGPQTTMQPRQPITLPPGGTTQGNMGATGFGEPLAFADKVAWSNQGNAQWAQQLLKFLPPELVQLLLQNDPSGRLMQLFGGSQPGASARMQIAEASPRNYGYGGGG